MATGTSNPPTVISERILANGDKLMVTKSEFKGKTYFGIRVWYTTDGIAYNPGKNGINLSIEEKVAFREGLTALLAALD